MLMRFRLMDKQLRRYAKSLAQRAHHRQRQRPLLRKNLGDSILSAKDWREVLLLQPFFLHAKPNGFDGCRAGELETLFLIVRHELREKFKSIAIGRTWSGIFGSEP